MNPAEELRKVYSIAKNAHEQANLVESGIDAGLLAVARYSAQRQREKCASVVGRFETEQSVAPLWMDE